MSWRPQGWYKFRWFFSFPKLMNSPFPKRSHLRNQEEESRLIESPIKFTHGKSRETRRPHLLCLQHCLASFPKENKNNTLTLSTQVQYLYGQGILYILLLVLQLFSPPSHYSAPETFCWDLKQKWTPRGFVVNFSNDTHELSETPSTNCI